MDTVEEGDMGALQGFGGAHIGEDHELLDQAMSLEARRHDDPVERAVGLEEELAFGKVEIERLALRARLLQRAHRPRRAGR